MPGIQQTTEVVTALLSLLVSSVEAKADDGHISRTEAVGILLGNSGALWQAVTGITEVPPELADLDPEELDSLMSIVLASQAWEATPTTTDIVTACYDAVRQILSTSRRIQHTLHPKRAVIVETSTFAEGQPLP